LDNQRHSQHILSQLYEYDSFMDSLRTIADMGCGTGEDIAWWATLMTRDDPPVPHNYNCFAVDVDARKLALVPELPNITKINRDFSEPQLFPVEIDLMWAHDSLQYSTNPLETLRVWNEQMNVNGMLVIAVPQHSGVEYNRYYSNTHSGCYFHHTPANLIYMLAVNGFDCNDAYLLKQYNDTWIHMAVYKSEIPPMDPSKTSLADLIDQGLLNPTVVESINRNNFIRQEEILYPWLDRENYFVDYVMPATEIPTEAGLPVDAGVFNEVKKSRKRSVKQASKKVAGVGLEPVGARQPPKKNQDDSE
jgi:trans-aconitate methyltransferase